MASVISASTTSATALNMSADTTGVLQLATGATPTTAVTVDTSQNVGIGTTTAASKVYISQSSTTAYSLITQTPVVGLTTGNYVNMAYFTNSRSTNNDGLRIVNLRDSTGSGVGNWETESYRIRRSVDFNDGTTGVQEEIVFGTNILGFNTAGSERMRIDSSGRVTISAQPRFLAYRSSDQTGYNATSQGDVVVIYNATTQNVGSHFSTSTGKFTAPVAGMYVFQASLWSNGGTPFVQAWLVINGARADYSDQSVSTTGNAIYSATFLIYLNANDSVGYHAYNATNTNQTITTSGNHTWFKGYLIS